MGKQNKMSKQHFFSTSNTYVANLSWFGQINERTTFEKFIVPGLNEPGKMDLEEYMNRNFQYNVSLDRFAYLTGRSLSTFHRDFKSIFNTTPGRWLLKKRLNEAYYQIMGKGLKPSDVYLQVGFEDLSHFSSTFKKAFGIAPSLAASILPAGSVPVG